MTILLFVIFWFGCGLTGAAGMNAHFRGEFPFIKHSDKEGWMNLWMALGFGLFGPALFIVGIFMTGCYWHGFNLRWRSEVD